MEELKDGKLILKESLTQVFSCEYYKIFKNIYFDENLRTTASAVPLTVNISSWVLVSALNSIGLLQRSLKDLKSSP